MNKKYGKKEVWFWYEMIQKQKGSNLTAAKFCQMHNLDRLAFHNMKLRINFKRYSNPELYEELLPIVRQYMEHGYPKGGRAYADKHNIKISDFNGMHLHLGYLNMIEEIKELNALKEKSSMQFVQVPSFQSAQPRPSIVPEPEILKKQNDVELIITTGVKVVVSPEVGADKLIRIIELLKDL